MTGSQFVSLHTHSCMSILDGMSKIPDLVQRAKTLGMPALGISDHGTLSGAFSLYQECNKVGIKPIIGIEAYVAPESRLTKSPLYWGDPDHRRDDLSFGAYTHMLLIAENATGLRNLYKLHELSYTEGFYYHPRVDLELLERYSEGVVATTGCAGGAVPTLLRLGQYDAAEDWAIKLENIFPGKLYLEMMHHGTDFDDELNRQLLELNERLDLPLLATNDSHYTIKGEAAVHQALLCIQTRSTLADPKFSFSGQGYWLKSRQEMEELPLPVEALDNTVKLATRVESYEDVFKHRNLMPKAEVVWGHELRSEVMRRVTGDKYVDRAKYELDIIEGMGYADYFLVLADIVSWARDHEIMVGPGRGSAGGSLVAYLLGITSIDPIGHGLLFERFLNPNRVSPPDIDLDFQDDRRDEVIEYAVRKYGADRVAQITTFGTIKAKAAIKDANRVLGGDYSEGERLVSFIPKAVRGREHPLKGLKHLDKANPEVYQLALGLEGVIRSTGKHAAGVIISPEPLSDLIPVKRGNSDNLLTTAFDQETLEAQGFVKIDLLGLRELSVIQKTLEMISDEDNNS